MCYGAFCNLEVYSSYKVTWHGSVTCLFCLQIHWFSIFNSFMMVIFLVGLVSMILMRTLRKDYARYSKEEEGDDMVTFVFVQCNIYVLTYIL